MKFLTFVAILALMWLVGLFVFAERYKEVGLLLDVEELLGGDGSRNTQGAGRKIPALARLLTGRSIQGLRAVWVVLGCGYRLQVVQRRVLVQVEIDVWPVFSWPCDNSGGACTCLAGHRLRGHLPVFRRTHPCAASNWWRTIHRFDSANSVLSCSVFFLSPR